MKVLVYNGSPKGELSITLQSMKFLELKKPDHEFKYINIIKAVRGGPEAIEEAILAVKDADLVLWCFPLYHLLVPAHMKLFMENIFSSDKRILFKDKYASAYTTSIHYYDNIAHDYIEGVSTDLGMKYLSGLSHDMQDLLQPDKQSELEFYFYNLVDSIMREQVIFPKFAPSVKSDFTYVPKLTDTDDRSKINTNKRTFIVTDAEPNSNIMGMINRYMACTNGPVDVIQLRDLDFHYCIGCCNCAAQNKCNFDDKDEYRDILDTILKEADIIIYAGELQDRYFGHKMKQYFDRTFCYTHIPIFKGKQIGYLVSGPLRQSPHMHEIMYAYASDETNLLGVVTDECADDTTLDALIHELVHQSILYAENNYRRTSMFQALSARMLFSEAIDNSLGGIFVEDYKFYKANHYLKKRPLLTPVKNAAFRFMMSRKRIRDDINKNMYHHMLAGHKKLIDHLRQSQV